MATMFEPLDMQYEKRADLHRAARLSMLHNRIVKRFEKVDHLADEVERAAATLVDVTHGSAVEAFQDAVRSSSSAAFLHLDGQTLGP
ncbi:MAG: hypothetical protein EOS52_23730 [Mesorhizobium sp.]|uniref:hypothetical protein n=1 Tax=Mesorhizobium sp. TaxID=1871066 RepID=UPI000FE637DC|nr:hypothetical protein [Mesorhizobium sp.]RWC10783.1 MAG: hypothetical protein EOS52_23730 [Mesorhizobium sp.]